MYEASMYEVLMYIVSMYHKLSRSTASTAYMYTDGREGGRALLHAGLCVICMYHVCSDANVKYEVEGW